MTRLEHLKKLPLQKRLQAMENIRRLNVFGLSESLNYNIDPRSTLYGAFALTDTKEGFSYWDKINDKYFR